MGWALAAAILPLASSGCSHHKTPPRVIETPVAFTLVRWCAVVDEETGRKLAALPNGRITTEGYTGRSCSNAELLRVLIQAEGEKRVLHVGGIRHDAFGEREPVARGDTWTSNGHVTINRVREGQPAQQQVVEVQCSGAGSIRPWGAPEGAGLSLSCTPRAAITDKSADRAGNRRTELNGSIRFDGTLPYESSLICLGRIGAVGGHNYDYVVAWQPTRSPDDLLSQLKELRERSGQALPPS